MNPYDLQFTMIELRTETPSLERILESLEAAVRFCEKQIDAAGKTGNYDYADQVFADESEAIDALVGVAFVTCQTYLVSVAAHLEEVHRMAGREGRTLSCVQSASPKIRVKLMSAFSPIVGQSGYTQVQVINAFANYFKHKDEWQCSWDELPQREKATADVLVAVGMTDCSSDLLTAGAKTLGVDANALKQMSQPVRNWIAAITAAHKTELRSIGLL